MSTLRIEARIDGELVLEAESQDVPRNEAEDGARALLAFVSAGIDENTDITPLD